MPTYDYACRACKHTFEWFQSIKAPVKRKCPACGASKLQRLIGSGGAIIFKGSGFYQTDYRSDSYKKGADAASKAASGGDKPADKPGESGGSKADKTADAPKPSGDGGGASSSDGKPASKKSDATKGGRSRGARSRRRSD